MPVGRVISFTGRFGFIATDANNLYFRAVDCTSPIGRNTSVRYDVDQVDGRPRAVNVRPVDLAALAECDRVFGATS